MRPLKKSCLRPPQTAKASFLTPSSRRRSNATEKGLLKNPLRAGRDPAVGAAYHAALPCRLHNTGRMICQTYMSDLPTSAKRNAGADLCVRPTPERGFSTAPGKERLHRRARGVEASRAGREAIAPALVAVDLRYGAYAPTQDEEGGGTAEPALSLSKGRYSG